MSDALLLLRVATAWLASAVTVGAAMSLRADSDGPAPGWVALLLAMAVLALLFWPMTKSRRRLPAFGAALLTLQLTGHALLLYAATGQVAHSGASGLFCCPATPGAGQTGLLSPLTANAGWLLLVVQLLVVATLAVPLRLLHKAFLDLAQALAGVLQTALPSLRGLLLLLAFSPSHAPGPVRPRPPAPVRARGRHVVGSVQRRGPPEHARVRSPFAPLSVPPGVCAA